MPERCEAVAKNGKPCSATPVPGLGRCAWHAPEWAEQRREWSRRGGKGKSNAARMRRQLPEAMTPGEIQSLLGAVLKGVVAGRVEPGVGNAAANLGRAIVAVREATEYEERLAALEAAAGIAGKTA